MHRVKRAENSQGLVRLSSFRPGMIPDQICYVQIKRTILAGTVPGRRSPGTEQGLNEYQIAISLKHIALPVSTIWFGKKRLAIPLLPSIPWVKKT